MADLELIENIRRTEGEIRQTAAEIKERRATLADQVAETPEHKKVVELAEALAIARKMLKATLADDKDYSIAAEVIGELTFKLKDLRDILSHHLIEYRDATNETFVPEQDSKKVRPIIVTAKQGKPEFHQEEMAFMNNKSRAAGEKDGA